MKDRLNALKEKLMLEWGELAARLEISRSMIDQLRGGQRNPSPKLERRIVDLEVSTGLPSNTSEVAQDGMVCEDVAPWPADKTDEVVAEMRKIRGQIAHVRTVLDDMSASLLYLEKRKKEK